MKLGMTAVQVRGISIWAALKIPGVIMFAATLFCSKLVAYVFLYWLPYYLNAIPVGGKRLTPQACLRQPAAHYSADPFVAMTLFSAQTYPDQ